MLPATSIESLATASFSLFDEVGGQQDQPHGSAGHVLPSPAGVAQMRAQSHRPSLGNRYTTPAARWSALTMRDPAASNAFIYAVRTTKIYCKPDCRARLARRANVVFYDTVEQARRDGFRACKRCKPDQSPSVGTQMTPSLSNPEVDDLHAISISGAPSSGPESVATDPEDVRTKIEHAVESIRQSALQGTQMSLSQLSKEVGLSKWHLHRVFKKLQGMTPKEMADGIRGKGLEATAVGVDALPVLEDGSGWVDLGVDSQPSFVQDVSSGMPPLLTSFSTPSTDSALTPAPWSDEAYLDPVLFPVDEHKELDIDAEVLLSDLFPELYGHYTLSAGLDCGGHGLV